MEIISKKDSVEIIPRQTKSFLNNEVLSFAKYVIETRAMPNIMDGIKVGARKILWAAISGDLTKRKLIKMPSLIGDAMKLHYNHGDASLLNTIVQLGSSHIYKYTPLDIVGQIGSLRVPKCGTAPRYLHIRPSKYLDFFKYDSELLQHLVEDGDKVEPKYFLPIIPLSLLIRTNSPGFGFSYRSFSYDLDSIIDNCIKAISNGSCNVDIDVTPIIPYVEGIKPENMLYNGNKNSWYNVGEYTMDFEKDILTINDLPYDINFEKYEEHLQSLVEKNYIIDFNDLSQDGTIRYVIKFSRGRLKLLSNDKWKFFQTLKLFSKIKKNTLNCIDQDGKTMLFFDTPYELVDCFVRKRLFFYQERKTKTIQVVKKEIASWENRIKFIELVINDKLIINKRAIVDIEKDLDSYFITHDVLKLKIEKLTQDEIEKLHNDLKTKKEYLDYLERTSIQEMYVRDLLEFKEKFSTIHKIDLTTKF